MFLTANYGFPQQHPYMPSRPSPLAERSANAYPHTFSFNMASQLQPQSQETKPTVPQRTHKPNPIVQTRDAATKRRRDMFFRRVQNGRDDKRWEARGEQIQQLDFFSEQKRWQAAKAREASQVPDDVIDEEAFGLGTSIDQSNNGPSPEEFNEADYILAQEEQELQQLVASMEDSTSQHYGSDDEDYDQLFREFADTSDFSHQQQHTSENFVDADAMDMS